MAPVPKTIVSKNYGPNLQHIHKDLNELWPWFLKFLQDNWKDANSIKVADIPLVRFRDKGTPADNLSNYDSAQERMLYVATTGICKRKYTSVCHCCIHVQAGKRCRV